MIMLLATLQVPMYVWPQIWKESPWLAGASVAGSGIAPQQHNFRISAVGVSVHLRRYVSCAT